MRHNTKLNNKGFTIIEVLIVLAIAGLIMLIVFLAVPALQRTQRNTARKNDVARVGGAVTEFSTDNNGKSPVAADLPAIRNKIGTLSQYDGTTQPILATKVQPALTAIDQIRIVTEAKCDTAGKTAAGTTRQIAVQYMSENTGAPTGLCQDL